MSESLIRECSGAAGQKRILSAGETSSAKRTQLISPQGMLFSVLIIRIIYRVSVVS